MSNILYYILQSVRNKGSTNDNGEDKHNKDKCSFHFEMHFVSISSFDKIEGNKLSDISKNIFFILAVMENVALL